MRLVVVWDGTPKTSRYLAAKEEQPPKDPRPDLLKQERRRESSRPLPSWRTRARGFRRGVELGAES